MQEISHRENTLKSPSRALDCNILPAPPILYDIPLHERSRDIWVVVGAGPSKDDWLEIATNHHASIVATNGACEFIANPNVYLVSDPDGIKKHIGYYEALRLNGVDIRIGEQDVKRGQPRCFKRVRSVGIHGVMHAIANGAKHIFLCGLDGWSADEMSYKRLNGGTASRIGTNENMARNIQSIQQMRPDVKIEFSRPGYISALLENGCVECEFCANPVKVPCVNVNPMIDGSCVTNIEKMPRHLFGDATIMVVGKGASAELDMDRTDVIRIAANPFPQHQHYDIACAADSAWWEDKWENLVAGAARPVLIPKYAGRHKMPIADNVFGVAMTNKKINGAIFSQCTAYWQGKHRSVHRGAIMAVMCALYLTRGKVIVTGCDLEGCDVAGNNYQHYQTERWRRACPGWTRVCASKHLTGPIVDENMLPKEENENVE